MGYNSGFKGLMHLHPTVYNACIPYNTS